MMARREAVPRWVIIGTLIALGANVLASTMTAVTIDLMRSMTDFAEAVRERDLDPATATIGRSRTRPRCSRSASICGRSFATSAAIRTNRRRRSCNGAPSARPLVVAAIGFLPWLISAVVFPLATVIRFGHWAPELASQQVLSPLVNGFLAATVNYLILDWLFRAMVVPRVFPDGRLAEVAGAIALGVRGTADRLPARRRVRAALHRARPDPGRGGARRHRRRRRRGPRGAHPGEPDDLRRLRRPRPRLHAAAGAAP